MRKVIMFILRRIVRALSLLLPIDNKKICVLCFLGRGGYSCNPKYICNELIRIDPGIKIILGSVKNNIGDLPPQISICDVHSLKWEIHLLTSKVWVDNHRKIFWKKRKNTLYFNTWHGGGMIKKIEKDAEESLSVQYIKMAIKDSKNIDLLLSDCSRMTEFFKKSFWYDGKVLECGLPRYKPLLNVDSSRCKATRSMLNIPDNTGIILYAPTFRKDQSLLPYQVDCTKVLAACEKRFGKSFIFLSRLHPNLIDKYDSLFKNSQNVMDVSYYNDIQELLAVSDIVISDFSSTIYDFSFTKRPAFRFIVDLDEYIRDRDTNFSLNDYPWPISKNNFELEKSILNFNEKEYCLKLDKYFKMLGVHIEDNPEMICARIIYDYLQGITKKELFDKYKLFLR